MIYVLFTAHPGVNGPVVDDIITITDGAPEVDPHEWDSYDEAFLRELEMHPEAARS